MKLNAPDRPIPVADAHDDAVGGPSDCRQRARDGGHDDKRMIANRRKGGRQAREQRIAMVMDLAYPAVRRRWRKRDGGAEGVGDSLMTEADAEDGRGGEQDRVAGDAEVAMVLRASGPGRNHDVVEAVIFQIIPGNPIVFCDDGFLSVNLSQELEQVEGEGIVVIDQKSLNHSARR